MNNIILHVNREYSVVCMNVGEKEDAITPLNTTVKRYSEVSKPPIDSLHAALIIELYKARKALDKIHSIAQSVDQYW